MRRRTDPSPVRVSLEATGADLLRPIDDLLAALDVTLWEVDRELRVTAAGGAGIRRLDARVEELIGRPIADVFQLADGHPFLAAFQRALAGETVVVRTEWGGRRFLTRLAPQLDAAGRRIGCAGISTPIPDDANGLPVALHEGAERLRRLIEECPIGIVRSHLDGRLLEANDYFLGLLGYTREDLEAGTIDWNDRTPAEYRPRDLAAAEEAMATGRSRPYEKEYRRRDGSRVPVLISLARMPGRIHEGIASILDLTPTKRLEQRLRAQVSAAAALAREDSLAVAAQELLRSLCETLGWSHGSLWLRNEETLRRAATWPLGDPEGRTSPDSSVGTETRDELDLPGRVWSTATPLWIDGETTEPPRARTDPGSREPTHWAVGIPVRSGADLIGVLELRSETSQAYDEDLVATLRAIASQLALFVDRGRAEEERRSCEATGRQHLERLRLHVELMPLAYIMGDESARVADWNPAAERIFGWSAAEAIGRDAVDLVVPPEARAGIRGLLRKMRDRPQASVSHRNENLTRDGKRILCDWINTPLFDETGRFSGFVAMAQDVTEQVRTEEGLRASEERYRSIVETTREGVWTGDLEGRTTFANAQLAEMMGCSVEALLGRSFLDFIPAAERQERRDDFPVLVAGEPVRDDIRLQRSDGTILWTEISATPLTDDDGSPTGALAMIDDVTEKRVLQAQLLQSQKMEVLGRLAGGVAHDFNNVLTVIGGYGELLVDRFAPDDPDRELVDEIRKAADHAASLTRQLLSFSRSVVVDVRVVDLNARINANEDMLRRLTGEDIELVVDLQPGLGRVRVDAAKLDQVLLNLVVNARDAMPRGGRLTIETADVDLDGHSAAGPPELHPGPYVRLAVRDTGTGIDPDVLPRIFEPFFTTKEQGQGTGLGLSTVYGIVKQFSGHVTARSEPGEGSCFEVYLPHVDDDVARGSARQPTPKSSGSETILLVEDEDAVRAFERRALTGAGYRVLEACNGAEAVALFEMRAAEIDMLVTDIVMPGMSGRELADTLLARAPGLPVLYVSGYTDDAVLRHGVLTAEASFLEKPFSAGALCTRVRSVLDAARNREHDEARG